MNPFLHGSLRLAQAVQSVSPIVGFGPVHPIWWWWSSGGKRREVATVSEWVGGCDGGGGGGHDDQIVPLQ